MLASQSDYFKTVKQCIAGQRPVDEEALSSIAVLTQRLERLRKTNPCFREVAFSEHLDELTHREMISALC